MPILHVDSASLSNAQITGSLFGTASFASTASFLPVGTYQITSSWAQSASQALTSSFYGGNISNSQLPSQINVTGISASFTGSLVGSLTGTASWATNAISSSFPIGVTGSTLYSVSPLSTNTPSEVGNIFLGNGAGSGASTRFSTFLGSNAGQSATFASHSVFIGGAAGQEAVSSSYSTYIGYFAGNSIGNRSPGRNNIIIGTSITLDKDRNDSINIGGIIFGTGSYYYPGPGTTQFSGSENIGRIGINKPLPIYTLDVSGSGNYTNDLTITGSLTVITGSSIELQVTNTGVRIGNTITDVHPVTGSLRVSGSITGSLLGTSSFATTALTASYVSTLRAAGDNQQIQFNSASLLSSSPDFVYDSTNYKLQHITNGNYEGQGYSSQGNDSFRLYNQFNSTNQYANLVHYSGMIDKFATKIIFQLTTGRAGGGDNNLSILGFKCDYCLLLFDDTYYSGTRVGTLLSAWDHDTTYTPELLDTFVSGDKTINELQNCVFTIADNGGDLALTLDNSINTKDVYYTLMFTIFTKNY